METAKELLAFAEAYWEEWKKDVEKEEGHNRFSDFSEENQASVSALGLLIFQMRKQVK